VGRQQYETGAILPALCAHSSLPASSPQSSFRDRRTSPQWLPRRITSTEIDGKKSIRTTLYRRSIFDSNGAHFNPAVTLADPSRSGIRGASPIAGDDGYPDAGNGVFKLTYKARVSKYPGRAGAPVAPA
jgi:hypothetical protein